MTARKFDPRAAARDALRRVDVATAELERAQAAALRIVRELGIIHPVESKLRQAHAASQQAGELLAGLATALERANRDLHGQVEKIRRSR